MFVRDDNYATNFITWMLLPAHDILSVFGRFLQLVFGFCTFWCKLIPFMPHPIPIVYNHILKAIQVAIESSFSAFSWIVRAFFTMHIIVLLYMVSTALWVLFWTGAVHLINYANAHGSHGLLDFAKLMIE